MLAVLPPRAVAAPATFAIEPGGSELKFYATSRLMNAEGRFHRFRGRVSLDRDDLTTARVTFSVETASIDTANRLRDDHLRSEDFFAVTRFPTATFESDRVERAAAGVSLVGRLTMRGVTRPLTIPVQVETIPVRVEIGDQALRAKGEFEIQRTAFGIAYQSRLNPIGETVRVVFTFLARPVDPRGALPPLREYAITTVATSDSSRGMGLHRIGNVADARQRPVRLVARLDSPRGRRYRSRSDQPTS